jgi:Protein of unknown function (DUF3617)
MKPLSVKPRSVLLAVALSLKVLAAVAQSQPPSHVSPQPGLWELSITTDGGPGGGATATGRTCLSPAHVETGAEQSLLDAAAQAVAASGGRKPPRCTVGELLRSPEQTRWQAHCEGPRGPMTGQGSGKLGAQEAELTQRFELKSPIGAMKLQQQVRARRVGACS